MKNLSFVSSPDLSEARLKKISISTARRLAMPVLVYILTTLADMTSPAGKANATTNYTIEDPETLAVEMIFEITRDQAEDKLKGIPDLFRRKRDTSVTQDMVSRITPAHMKMLALADKRSVFRWAEAI